MTQDPAIWSDTQDLLAARDEPKWASLSWITLRPLISAVNDRINGFAPRLVDELRTQWTAKVSDSGPGAAWPPVEAGGRTFRRVVRRPTQSAFILLGDTGEQDASQYVLVPALRAAAAGGPAAERPAFMLVCSDVVYPSGDVNDYVHALYLPYGPRPPHRCAGRPAADGIGEDPGEDPRDRTGTGPTDALARLDLLALPGNHDWYDGLTGFSTQFTGLDPLPATAGGWTEGIRLTEAMARLLWRRPTRAGRARLWRRTGGSCSETQPPRPQEELVPLERIRAGRVTGAGIGDAADWRPLQPGPYYAVETRDVLLVCIDAGIAVNGEPHLDAEQSAWLVEISRYPKPKLLLTGNPLLVNALWKKATLDTSGVDLEDGEPMPHEVRDLVHDARYGYVASIGGDIHNFQEYTVPLPDGRTMHHVVSGGGGAYTSATHPVLVAAHRRAARVAAGRTPYPGESDPGPEPDRMYPTPAQSLQQFARLILVRLWRFLQVLGAVLAGIAVPLVAAALRDDPTAGPGWWAGAASALVAAFVLVRVFMRPEATRTAFYRAAFFVATAAAGALVLLALWWVEPRHVVRYGVGWAGLTLGGCVLAWLVRRSSWWREPRGGDDHPPSWVGPLAGVLWVAVTVPAALRGHWWVAGTLFALLVVAVAGWFARRSTMPMRLTWNTTGAVLSYTAQAAVALAVVAQVLLDDARALLVLAVPAGIVAAVLWPIAALAAETLLLGGVLRLLRPASWRLRYGSTARPAQWTLGTVVVAGPVALVWWLARGTPALASGWSGWWGVAASSLASLVVGVVAVLLVDAVRRGHPGRDYKIINLVLLAMAGSGYVVLFRGTWAPRVTVALLAVAALAVLTVVLVNLTFLGTYALLLDGDARTADRPGFHAFTPDEAVAILRWRLGTGPKPTDSRLVRRAQIVFPSTDQPQGPVQRKVSEIFDSDTPPFAKHFLVVRTTPGALTISPRPVDGLSNLPPLAPIVVPLAAARASVIGPLPDLDDAAFGGGPSDPDGGPAGGPVDLTRQEGGVRPASA